MCNCIHEKDDGLRQRGYKLADDCMMLELVEASLSLAACFGLPLERTDGKRLKRDSHRMKDIATCGAPTGTNPSADTLDRARPFSTAPNP